MNKEQAKSVLKLGNTLLDQAARIAELEKEVALGKQMYSELWQNAAASELENARLKRNWEVLRGYLKDRDDRALDCFCAERAMDQMREIEGKPEDGKED